MKLYFFLVILFPFITFAQTGKIEGKITDNETGKPLVGANIILQNAQKGAATIGEGKYIINKIPEGNYNVLISYMGYNSVIVKDVNVSSNDLTELNISLPRNKNFNMPKEMESFYLEQLPEKIKNKLMEIKGTDQKEYFRTLQETYFDYLLQKKDNNKLESELLELEVEAKSLALNYKNASAEKKETIYRDMINNISNQFDIKHKLRLKDLSIMNKKLESIEKSIEDSKKNKDEYIQEKLNQLLGS